MESTSNYHILESSTATQTEDQEEEQVHHQIVNHSSLHSFFSSPSSLKSLEELSSENLEKSTVTVLNWSGTHQVDVPSPFYFEPTSDEEVLSILSSCHETNQPVQPVGSALSPNGLSCQPQGMISLENLDSILDIKAIPSDAGIVRVQA